MPAWLIEIIGKSPIVAGIGLVVFFLYKVVDRAMDSPASIATWFLFAGKERRKDALDFLKVLRDQGDQPPQVEGPPDDRPLSPQRWRRRKRKRRR
ncbi:MAG: hypothetical protein ACRDSE_00450 [Pseudonocardiaceae bacterium]